MRLFRSTLSYGMQTTLHAALGAAVDIERAARGLDGFTEELAKLTKGLDDHAFEGLNELPLAQVLEKLGHPKFRTVTEVHEALRHYLTQLRTIEVFGIGDYERMKEFCMELNSALLDSYESFEPRFLVA